MPRDDGLPPPVGKGRRGPEMTPDNPSIYGKLEQLAGQQGGGRGMGGGDQEAAQLLMSGAQQMMQAAQMKPELQPIITQALQIIQQGVSGLGGGGEMGSEEAGGETKSKKRVKPPKGSEQGAEEEGVDQFAY